MKEGPSVKALGNIYLKKFIKIGKELVIKNLRVYITKIGKYIYMNNYIMLWSFFRPRLYSVRYRHC